MTTITYSAFTDIGNGLSTRIVDVYAIAPEKGNITSNFDLPDEIGGRNYMVEISGDSSGQTVDISRDSDCHPCGNGGYRGVQAWKSRG